MGTLRLAKNPSTVEFVFEDQSSYHRVFLELQLRLGGIDGVEYLSSDSDHILRISLKDLEYLMLTDGWIPEEIEIDGSLLQELKKFHSSQSEMDTPIDGWGREQILQHLTDIYSIRRTPTDFQLRNLELMLSYPVAASFSVPGSGKTAEGLCYWLCRRGDSEKLMVVLPKVGFLAWEEEFQEWLGWGNEKVVRLDASGEGLEDIIQGNETARVFLITYARLYINSEIIARFMGTADWSMILDESHNIKRHSGAYSQAVRRIGSMARCSRVILTGTPAPQGAEDLWPQAEFLRNARMSSADSAAWISGIKVRTTKEELGLLCTQLIPIRQALPSAHQNLYDLITSRLARQIAAGTDIEQRRRLDGLRSHIMDIMRAASNPAILCSIPEFAEALGPQGVADILATPSWKVEETLRIVSDLIRDGRKVIIWSYFNDNTDILANRLKHCNPRIIRGETPSSHSVIEDEKLDERTREGILHDFKTRDDCNIIIANPAACGESISLHHWCHDAIYFDRSYNAGQYLQSCDRIHRFGYHPKTGRNTCAEETVTYYILESTGTIDERISTRLTDKIDRQKAILNSGDYTQPLTESGSSRRDATGMSDLDREDLVDHIRDVGGF